MIDVAVAHHQGVDALDAGVTQVRHHRRRTEVEIGAEARAGVVDQRVPAGAHHRGQPLPHIEHGEPGLARTRLRRPVERQRQQQDETGGAQRPGPRTQQQRDADEPGCEHD